jgi:hypothetical protein
LISFVETLDFEILTIERQLSFSGSRDLGRTDFVGEIIAAIVWDRCRKNVRWVVAPR